MNNDLPKNKNRPFTLNGIHFASRKEYDDRVERDANQLAQLLYDIYKDKKRKEAIDGQPKDNNTAQTMV